MTRTTSDELLMRDDDFIVSKTDPKGRITYGNRTFIEFSGFHEEQLLNQPHSIIRHPDMPRAVFRLLWNTLQQGREFFGIIKNLSNTGQFYWTFAHVTPSLSPTGELLGYYSVRRSPHRDAVTTFDTLYRQMREEETRHQSAREAMDAADQLLQQHINASGKSYHEYLFAFKH